MRHPIRSNRLWLTAASLAASLTGASAQAPDAAAQILSAMRQASGGGGWQSVKSLHLTMSASAGGLHAPLERWEDVTAGRYMTRAAWPTYVAQDGYDGVTTWHAGRSGIAYVLGDVDARLVAADESFRVARGWWFPERHPATIAWAGTRTDGARTFDVLQVTPEGGRAFQAWVDQATHLLARTDEQQAEDRMVTMYDDYRLVNGLRLPFSISTGDGSDVDETDTVQSVEINPSIPDSQYGVPPAPPSDVVWPPGRDTVDVPFRLTADNRILVPVRLNGGQALQAEFDSGGSLVIQPPLVAKLHLASAGQFKQRGGGEGFIAATDGQIDSLALGDVSVLAPRFHSAAFAPDDPDRILVGLETLQRFVARFDFDRQVMTLSKPGTFSYTGLGVTVPFHFQDNQPEVAGSIDGLAGLFTIDTGDSGSLLLIAPFARRYGLVERYRADLPYSGKAVAATHGVWARQRAGVVAFNGADGRPIAQVHDPVTRISLQKSGFDANRNVSANIGLGILKQFNLTFDYARHQIILEPNHLYGAKDVFNRAGFRLRHEGGQWVVSVVYPGSPAAEAGIATGDIISGIDGQAPDDLGQEGVWRKLEGPIGTEMRVDAQISGKSRSVRLVLRDLL